MLRGTVPYFLVLLVLAHMASSAWSKLDISKSACINDTLLVQVQFEGKCSNPSLRCRGPNKKRCIWTQNGMIIRGVQRSDEGNFTLKRYCTEGIQLCVLHLKVDCESISAYPGSTATMPWPHPNIPENAIMKSSIIFVTEFSNNPKVRITLAKNGRITREAQEIFGDRVTIRPDNHTLTIENMRKEEEGNYTILWRWTKGNYLSSTRYTFHVTLVHEEATGFHSPASTPDPAPNATTYLNISTPAVPDASALAMMLVPCNGFLFLLPCVLAVSPVLFLR